MPAGSCGFRMSRSARSCTGLDLTFPVGSFTAIVGESGCGKSTISSILMGRSRGYGGSVTIGGAELCTIREESLMRHITYVSHQSYLFKGTVRENLLMGCPAADDAALWRALEQVKLADFLRGEQGLDTPLAEKGGNLSGGQCQRLALARALLHDSPVYIFDEATSNIDVESENEIMAQIHALAGKRTVILISHRLANVTACDRIYALEKGACAGCGTHEELLAQHGVYAGSGRRSRRSKTSERTVSGHEKTERLYRDGAAHRSGAPPRGVHGARHRHGSDRPPVRVVHHDLRRVGHARPAGL